MNDSDQNNLSASLEDYLEVIFHVISEKTAVRPKDMATRLGVTNASVTGALRALAEKKLINYAPYDTITLTQEGELQARRIVHHHAALKNFFIKILAVDENEADRAACRIKHDISANVVERLALFANFIKNCPRAGNPWVTQFTQKFLKDGACTDCGTCVVNMISGAFKGPQEVL